MRVSRFTKRLRWAILLIGAAAVLLVFYTGYQAARTKSALNATADNFQTLSRQLTSGNGAGARRTLVDAQRNAQVAKENTSGPGWWLTSKLPGVGDDVDAVRTVTDVVDQLAQSVLPRVVTAAETLDPSRLRPSKGRVELGPIEAIAPDVVDANRELQAEYSRISAIITGDLAPQIAAPVSQFEVRLGDAASLSDRAARAVQLLPSMLGADGERTYLFLFQSNAELRATGGLPGAFAIITARDGRVSIAGQSTPGALGKFANPPIPLTDQEKALFGNQMGVYIQDANFTPDFPRAAELVKAMWEARGGRQIDGVLATDPVALSRLLGGMGSVRLANGSTLSAGNVVKQLLSRAYFDISDPDAQNAYFANVARSVFDAFASGQGEPQAVFSGLTKATNEHRLLIWSAMQSEQRLLTGTALGGDLATRAAGAPEVGIYFNDAQASKMDYYLDYEATVDSTRCQADRQYLTVDLRLTSTAPLDVGSLPESVTGPGTAAPRGSIQVSTFIYAPVDGYITSVRLNDGELDYNEKEHKGRDVVNQTILLAPGQTVTLGVDVVTGEGQVDTPKLDVTPGANGTGIGEIGESAC